MPALARTLLVAGAALAAASCWQRDALPPPERLDPALEQEPLQRAVATEPFQTTVGGITYTVRPLYAYELHGLVVSKHDADTWWDYIHAAANDRLNVTDLCVVWGRNAKSGSYRGIDFSSGQFVCYARTSSSEAWAAFDPASLSNNHLLTDDPRIADTLKSTRIGDQIHVRGYLAEYSHDHGFAFRRGTSVTRTDSGDGACETVFATDAAILRAANPGWRAALWLGLALVVAGFAAWALAPPRARD
jgi:hypothetical protein